MAKVIRKTKPKASKPAAKKKPVSKKKPVAKKKIVSKKEKDEAELIAEAALKSMAEKKGGEAVSLDLRELGNRVTDFFVICHGESRTHTEGIANFVEDEIQKATGAKPWHREGFENAEWILLDYITVVVHIFQKDLRSFYALERLWADADVRRAEAV